MPLSPLRFRFLVISLLTVSFLGALDNTVVTTALATVAGQLGALEHMSWIVVGYTLASTVLLPVFGSLGDRVGARGVFLASLVVFIVSSVACGFAHDFVWLIVARVIQGMSSAGLQLMSQTIIAETTTPRQRPKYLAIIGAAFPIAILIGPVLGGLITDYWGWPWVFWVNAPVGILALALALVAIPHLPRTVRAGFDVAGAVTLAIGLVALVLAVTWIGVDGGACVAALAISAIGFSAFVLVELRAAQPLVPIRLFADRTMVTGTAISAIVGIGLFSLTAYLPTYFQMAYRTSATVSGFVPIATVFGMLVSNLTSGWLASRTGHYRVFAVVGTALGATGLGTMALLPPGLPLWAPMAVMALVGLGTGAFMSLIVAVVQSAAPASETGAVTATVNLVRQVGATVTTAIIGTLVGFGVAAALPAGLDAATLTPAVVHSAPARLQADVASIYSDVFAPIFGTLALVYVAGIVASVLLPAGRLADAADAAPEPTEPVAV
ncbi:MFS transporter permease [Microbacterium mangrovi]|uniref:MFS transporter permease n=1 Tax=Microbacterium mangrovi TaxID=1348253 RepID=A0A0B2A316_9MICO|nr:MFS transporter [Microbacterium mangrovi]KHK97435.1 MFS transporter permease [Microbacterium mangrovi]